MRATCSWIVPDAKMRYALKPASIVTRIAVAASLTLLLFAGGMLILIKTDIESAVYAATDTSVQVAQNVFADLIRSKGPPSLRAGHAAPGKLGRER